MSAQVPEISAARDSGTAGDDDCVVNWIAAIGIGFADFAAPAAFVPGLEGDLLISSTTADGTGTVGRSNALTMDHNERFGGAFVREVQEWITAVSRDEHTGSSAWDGYAAACVCDAGVRALTEDGEVAVEMIDKPALYA